MALIDALMAGQQFVAGMQQQQQAAREYSDRMAMLARQEERAMREEERQMMADFRAQEFQDFETQRLIAADKRAEEQFMREGITSRLTQEQMRQAIETGKLEIASLKRDAENAATREERERLDWELRQKIATLQLIEAQSAYNARQANAKLQQEFNSVQTQLTRFARRAVIDPASITAQEAVDTEKIFYDFIEKNPGQVVAMGQYYTPFFNALKLAEESEGSLLTQKGISAAYKKQHGQDITSTRSFGMAGTGGGRAVPLTQKEKDYYSGLQEAYKPLREYEKLRDQREGFLSLIGQPLAASMMSALPQED